MHLCDRAVALHRARVENVELSVAPAADRRSTLQGIASLADKAPSRSPYFMTRRRSHRPDREVPDRERGADRPEHLRERSRIETFDHGQHFLRAPRIDEVYGALAVQHRMATHATRAASLRACRSQLSRSTTYRSSAMTVCVRRSGEALPLDHRDTVAGETATMLAMSLPWSPPSSRSRSRILLTAFATQFLCQGFQRLAQKSPALWIAYRFHYVNQMKSICQASSDAIDPQRKRILTQKFRSMLLMDSVRSFHIKI